MKENDIYDVTIIGGGPAGLYSSFYSGLRGLKTKIIESQSQLGGKIHFYLEKIIWDAGGHTPITGQQLIENLVKQGLTFNPTVVLNEKVETIHRDSNGLFNLISHTGQTHISRTVIIAIGSGIIKPQKLKVEGAERYEVTNLHYTVKSLNQFKDKTVLISGGGNTAIDWANELIPIAKKVYITYRKEEFKGHESQVSNLLSSSATCLVNTEILNLISDSSRNYIEFVELKDVTTNEHFQIPVDEVIISHGYEIDASLVKNSPLNIKMVNDFYIHGNSKCETSVQGIYAAGDIIQYEGKLQLIVGTFQDAANAVNQAKSFLDPKANPTGMVSSHNEIFKEKNKQIIKELISGGTLT